MSRRPPLCSTCPGAPAGVPIVFGLPSPELMDAAARGEVVLAGCVLDDGPTPRWACPQCGDYLRWGPARPAGLSPTDSPRTGFLRVGTWNLRACPPRWSDKGEAAAWWQDQMAADIWLLTEVHEDWGRHEGSWAVSPPRGGDQTSGKRWAGIHTQLPMAELDGGASHDWTDLHELDGVAAEESLCLARVHLPEGRRFPSVLVACSVIPWRGAGRWWPGLPERSLDAQQEFVLGHHAERIAGAWDGAEPIIWGGDFNQELQPLTPGRRAAGYGLAGTVAGIERLRSAFERFGLRPLTDDAAHLDAAASAIDHLAVSGALVHGKAGVWRPHHPHGAALSDHAAYVADVDV